MTSKNLFLNLMKEDIRRRLFIPAISLVIFFFWFPVSTLISFVPQSIRFNDEPINKEELINGMIRAFNSLCNNRGLTFVLIVLFVIAAFTGFNFHFKANKADFLHGIPVNRKILYLVFITDGFLMVYLPVFLMSVIGTVFMAIRTGKPDPFLILFSCLFYNLTRGVLCYACAILAVMITGNVISAFLGLMFIFFYPTIISYSILGMHVNYFATYYAQEKIMESMAKYTSAFIYSMMDDPEDLPMMILSAVVALLLAFILFFISYVLYEKRAIETVGKAIAFRKAEAPIKFLLVVPIAIGGAVLFENIAGIPTAVFGFACALLISHSVLEIIYNSDFKKLFSHPLQMVACGILGMVIYLGFCFDITGYDSFIPSKVLVKDVGVYSNVLENNMSELNVKVTRDDTKYMYGDYNSDFQDDLVKKMKFKDVDTIFAIAKNGIRHTKKNRLSLRNLFIGNFDNEQLVNPNNILICYHLKGGFKIYREYTIDGYEVIKELDSIHDSKEFKDAVYPILSSTWEDYAKVYCQDMTGERPIYATDESGRMLLETYKTELSNLTMDTRRYEKPVACLHFVNYQYEDYITAFKMGTRNYEYYGFAELGYYPVYPSFSGTLSAMRNMGYNVNQEILSAGIYKAEVRFGANNPAEFIDASSIQQLYDCAVYDLKYHNEICPMYRQLTLNLYLEDYFEVADPKNASDNPSYKGEIVNLTMNARKLPEFINYRFFLDTTDGPDCRDYAYKAPDEEDIYYPEMYEPDSEGLQI